MRNLSVYYGSLLALDGISFSITCGHTLALMGPNGAGKSTLIKALAGLLRPDSGEILWNGSPLHDTPGEIAYLPQRSDVDWSFPITVRALVEMGRYPSLGLWKKFGRHDRDIVEKSLHALGMESLADRQISELSGGQQQRAFLARALAQEAHVLLLDEPFTGLDAPACQSLGRLLDSLAAEGRLVIASHHDLNTAADIFDTILLMNRELVAFGPPGKCLLPHASGRRMEWNLNRKPKFHDGRLSSIPPRTHRAALPAGMRHDRLRQRLRQRAGHPEKIGSPDRHALLRPAAGHSGGGAPLRPHPLEPPDGAVVAALLVGLGSLFVSRTSRLNQDTALSILHTTAFAAGFIVLVRLGLQQKIDDWLFGSIMSLSDSDLWIAFAISSVSVLTCFSSAAPS